MPGSGQREPGPAVTVTIGSSQATSSDSSSAELEKSNFVVGEGSTARFTVREKLSRLPAPNDAVLETSAITGEVQFNGDEFVVSIDLHKLRSDQSRRDGYVRDRLFPRQPIARVTFQGIDELPAGLSDGEEISAMLAGVVNVNGVDAGITFEIEARLDGDVLFMLGRADFQWEEFGMTAPKSALFDVEDDVHVEVLLVTER